MKLLPTGLLLAAHVVALPVAAQEAADPFASRPRAQVMLLGTFHFDDPGLDAYKPQFPWNPLTPEHQGEIEEVVERLAAFRPTRIAVEWPVRRQARLDSLYRAYTAGSSELGPGEVQQIGFRLARRLGHDRVHAIDAAGRAYEPDMTQEQYNAHVARLSEGADPELAARQAALHASYMALYRAQDSLKTVVPLREYLVQRNTEDRILHSHGHYLIGSFRLGRDDDYFGPDAGTRWYNRNLRIFHNIQRITTAPDDRILVIIGAGHLPILRHAVQASPEYRLVEVSDYLAADTSHTARAPAPH